MFLDQTITVSSEVLAQEVSGEMVLLDLNSEQYLGLNEVGAMVWQLLEDNTELEIIFGKLLGEYEVEAKTLESDLVQLIADMSEAGVITVAKKEQ